MCCTLAKVERQSLHAISKYSDFGYRLVNVSVLDKPHWIVGDEKSRRSVFSLRGPGRNDPICALLAPEYGSAIAHVNECSIVRRYDGGDEGGSELARGCVSSASGKDDSLANFFKPFVRDILGQ
jgi:hypothetical protein